MILVYNPLDEHSKIFNSLTLCHFEVEHPSDRESGNEKDTPIAEVVLLETGAE